LTINVKECLVYIILSQFCSFIIRKDIRALMSWKHVWYRSVHYFCWAT